MDRKKKLLSNESKKKPKELKLQFEKFLASEVEEGKISEDKEADIIQALTEMSIEKKKRRGKKLQDAIDTTDRELFQNLLAGYYFDPNHPDDTSQTDRLREDYITFLRKKARQEKYATDSYQTQKWTKNIGKTIGKREQQEDYVVSWQESEERSWQTALQERMKGLIVDILQLLKNTALKDNVQALTVLAMLGLLPSDEEEIQQDVQMLQDHKGSLDELHMTFSSHEWFVKLYAQLESKQANQLTNIVATFKEDGVNLYEAWVKQLTIYQQEQEKQLARLIEETKDYQDLQEKLPVHPSQFMDHFPTAKARDQQAYTQKRRDLQQLIASTAKQQEQVKEEFAISSSLHQAGVEKDALQVSLDQIITRQTIAILELEDIEKDGLATEKKAYSTLLEKIYKRLGEQQENLIKVNTQIQATKAFLEDNEDHPASSYLVNQYLRLENTYKTTKNMLVQLEKKLNNAVDVVFAKDMQEYTDLQKVITAELFACHELKQQDIAEHVQENSELFEKLHQLEKILSPWEKTGETKVFHDLLVQQDYLATIYTRVTNQDAHTGTVERKENPTASFLAAFSHAAHTAKPVEISEALRTYLAWIQHLQTYGCVVWEEGEVKLSYYHGKLYLMSGPYLASYATPQEFFSTQEFILEDFTDKEHILNGKSNDMRYTLALNKNNIIKTINHYAKQYTAQDIHYLQGIDIATVPGVMRDIFNAADYTFEQILTGLTYVFGQGAEGEAMGKQYMQELYDTIHSTATTGGKHDQQFLRLAEHIIAGRPWESFEIFHSPPEWVIAHQEKIHGRMKKEKKEQTYNKVMERVQELQEKHIVTYGEHYGKEEMLDTITDTAFNLAAMTPHPERRRGEYNDGAHQYKSLLDRKGNTSWFYDAGSIPDTALVYKGTIDGKSKHPEEVEQFVEQLQRDIYDAGYERTTEDTYKKSAEALFPGMSDDEKILGMSLLTGEEGWYWFQKEGEISTGPKNGKIKFTNKCIDKTRPCMGSLAGYRDFGSRNYKYDDMAIPSSRSVGP